MHAAIAAGELAFNRGGKLHDARIYVSTCYAALAIALGAICVGLWNADLLLSEKGFYAVSFILAMFSAITMQKNIRDVQLLDATGAVRTAVSKPASDVADAQ